MSKELDTNEINETTLTKEIKRSIEAIVANKKKIALDQEALKEDIEATAQKLGVKKGVLSRRIDLIIKEEEKGGEVKSKSDDIEFVEKYFDIQ